MTDKAIIEAWLEAYKEAWETRDPEAFARLFAMDACYSWAPGGPLDWPRAVIVASWQRALADLEDLKVSCEVTEMYEDTCAVLWKVEQTARLTGARTQTWGTLIVQLNEHGLCKSIDEMWMSERQLV